jgi:hypothetical protein
VRRRPDAVPGGIAAGLQVVVRLPDEDAALERAAARACA